MKILCKHQYVPFIQEDKKLDRNKIPFGKTREVKITTAVICLKCLNVKLLDKSLKDFRLLY